MTFYVINLANSSSTTQNVFLFLKAKVLSLSFVLIKSNWKNQVKSISKHQIHFLLKLFFFNLNESQEAGKNLMKEQRFLCVTGNIFQQIFLHVWVDLLKYSDCMSHIENHCSPQWCPQPIAMTQVNGMPYFSIFKVFHSVLHVNSQKIAFFFF